MAEERLHKIMAAAGIGSRRACEQMILDGHVQVNGRVISEMGVKVDPTTDEILVDGKPLSIPDRHVYIKMNKPRGVISDIGGDAGDHRSVASLLPERMRRVFPVGRLDLNSEGLVLLTDDGELAHHLTHPSFEHPKQYYALVGEQPSIDALEKFRGGIDLPTGRTAPARIRVVDEPPAELILAKGPNRGVWLEATLHEGKKRQIRHMLAAVGYPVLRLVRWSIGPLTLGRVRPGEWATLHGREANALRAFVGLPPTAVEDAAEEERKPRHGKAIAAGAAGATVYGATRRGPRRDDDRPRKPRAYGTGKPRSEGAGGSSGGGATRHGGPRPGGSRPGASRSAPSGRGATMGGSRGSDSRSSDSRSSESRGSESRGGTSSGSARSGAPRSGGSGGYGGRPSSGSGRSSGASGSSGYSGSSGSSGASGSSGSSRPYSSSRPGGSSRSSGGSSRSSGGSSRSSGGSSSGSSRPPRSGSSGSGSRSSGSGSGSSGKSSSSR